MSFYKEFYDRMLIHLQTKPIDSLFIGSSENINKMRTTYQSLNSLTKFIEWVEQQIILEDLVAEGAVPDKFASMFFIAGGSVNG